MDALARICLSINRTTRQPECIDDVFRVKSRRFSAFLGRIAGDLTYILRRVTFSCQVLRTMKKRLLDSEYSNDRKRAAAIVRRPLFNIFIGYYLFSAFSWLLYDLYEVAGVKQSLCRSLDALFGESGDSLIRFFVIVVAES